MRLGLEQEEGLDRNLLLCRLGGVKLRDAGFLG